MQNLSREARLAIAVCSALALGTIWAFPYQPGLDLPEHAHLFALWANFSDAKRGLGIFYDIQLFTPYLLTYLLAYPFTKVFGAIAAVKCLLTIIAFATPYTLWRWLRSIGGEPSWALTGFALAFGYPYIWGFTSFSLSLPVAFLCQEAWTRAPDVPPLRAALRLAGLLTALFLTHAMTFGAVATSCGLLTLWSFRRAFWRRSAAVATAGTVSLIWYLRQGHSQQAPTSGPPDTARFASLFGAEFHIFDSYWASALGFAMLAVVIATARPVFATPVQRWLPLALCLAAFFSIPTFVMGTAFVGSRFVWLAHAFAPAAFAVTVQGRSLDWARRISSTLVVAFLAICLFRVAAMNRELRGFHKIAQQVPEGGDVRGAMQIESDDSEYFGADQFANIFAWATAEHLGMVQNDHARFFQLPLLRSRDTPFPSEFRYLIGHGPTAVRNLRREAKSARLVAEADGWVLYEDPTAPPLATPAGTVVRWAQDWGRMRVDRSVSGSPLQVAGTRYERGLGTHARSVIELRTRAAGALRGACGMDDVGYAPRGVVCSIEDRAERVLFKVLVAPKTAPKPFSIEVAAEQTLYLRTAMPDAGDISGAAVDWLSVKLTAK